MSGRDLRLGLRGEGSVLERPGPYLWHPERIRIGRGVRVCREARLQVNLDDARPPLDPWIDIGDHAVIGAGCQISATAGVTIGAAARISAEVLILDNSHGYEDPDTPIPDQPVLVAGPIRIGEGAFIGRGAVILGGVTIGKGAVVVDRALVREDVPAGTWVLGAPARTAGAPPFRAAGGGSP